MTSHDLFSGDAHALSRLMVVESAEPSSWTTDDLASILQHQLRSPLVFDLKGLEPTRPTIVERSQELPLRTFGDIFIHENPPVELLRLIKEFAKGSDKRIDGPLPPEVATVLYFTAIAVAKLRLGINISTLDSRATTEAIEWVLQLPWIDSSIQRIFEEARLASSVESHSAHPPL